MIYSHTKHEVDVHGSRGKCTLPDIHFFATEHNHNQFKEHIQIVSLYATECLIYRANKMDRAIVFAPKVNATSLKWAFHVHAECNNV